MRYKIYYLITLLAATTFSSCNDWLDVNPRSQIKSELLFETEDGFKQATNGVYIRLNKNDLFGKNASMYVTETMARTWAVPKRDEHLTMYSLANYDFTDKGVESIISDMFSAYYNAIAQCNDILANLEQSNIQFTYNNDKLIKGELLGLRAFLHLDVLRLWGPYPSTAQDNEPAIPYVTDMTNDVAKLRSKTWHEVTSLIEKDLNEAELILAEVDPIVYADIDSLNSSNSASFVGIGTMPNDEWQTKRQARFSYYAVLGTKARFYHWISDTKNAIKYAQMVIDDEKYKLCTESNSTWTMVPEHLFDIDNINMLTDDMLANFDSDKAPFTQIERSVNTAFENTTQPGDIRGANSGYWEKHSYGNGASTYVFCKYIGNETVKSDKRIPLLRYAEMYLILIEDLPLNEALPYFQTYRLARGLDENLETTMFASETARTAQLEKEWRKEFFGEGQIFAYYKKHNVANLTWPSKVTLPTNVFIIPKPKGITNFE